MRVSLENDEKKASWNNRFAFLYTSILQSESTAGDQPHGSPERTAAVKMAHSIIFVLPGVLNLTSIKEYYIGNLDFCFSEAEMKTSM